MRLHIVALARAWIGTPYHHQASVRGVGTDCVGLVRGSFASCMATTPRPPPPTRATGPRRGARELLDAARRHLIEIAEIRRPRRRAGLPLPRRSLAKHAAIIARPPP